jgi:tetratricopeptide (TPR) repeat protein
VATAQELVEQGIRAYVEGRLDESRRLLEEALQVDPGNSRARSYLLLLPGGLSSGVVNRPSRTMAALGQAAPRFTPVPFPAARATPLPFLPEAPTATLAPVATPTPAPAPTPTPAPAPTLTPPPTPTPAPAPTPAPTPTPTPLEVEAQPLPELSFDIPIEITGEHAIGQPPEAPVEPSPMPWPSPSGEPPAAPEPTPPEPTPPEPTPLELAADATAGSQPHHEPASDYAPSPWDDGPASAPSIVLGSEGGLDLDAVAEKSDVRLLVPKAGRPSTPQEDVAVWMVAAKDLLALGDFSGSLEMIEKILKVDPEHAEARDYLTANESTLVAMYESKLGPLTRIPRLAIKPEEIMWLNLDHRAGFLLSQIDGAVDYETLFALSGLPRLDTARILAGLLADDVITA